MDLRGDWTVRRPATGVHPTQHSVWARVWVWKSSWDCRRTRCAWWNLRTIARAVVWPLQMRSVSSHRTILWPNRGAKIDLLTEKNGVICLPLEATDAHFHECFRKYYTMRWKRSHWWVILTHPGRSSQTFRPASWSAPNQTVDPVQSPRPSPQNRHP